MVDTSNQPNSEYQYDWQNPDLKKFDFGRMMTRTFRGALYCGKQFWLPILLVFVIPTFLISLWPMFLPDGAYGGLLTGDGFEGFEDFFTPLNVLFIALFYFGYLSVYAIFYVAISHNVYGFYIDDVPTFKESFYRGRQRLLASIGAMIIFTFGIMFGFLLLFIPGLLLMLGWYLLSPILAIEDKGVIDSLGRSWSMSKGSKRWVLLFLVVVTLISVVATTLFGLIAMPFGNSALALLEGGSTTFWIMNAIATAISQIIVLLLTVAGLTSIYYEIRDIKEGVSQDKISAVFD